MIVKLLAEETDLGVATDVEQATVVRLYNSGVDVLVEVKDGATTVSSVTLAEGEIIHLQKQASHLVVATSDVKAVKVAHAN
jgi:hypothetical protein